MIRTKLLASFLLLTMLVSTFSPIPTQYVFADTNGPTPTERPTPPPKPTAPQAPTPPPTPIAPFALHTPQPSPSATVEKGSGNNTTTQPLPDVSTVSGQQGASYNVGDGSIRTGDATVNGTIVNNANNNTVNPLGGGTGNGEGVGSSITNGANGANSTNKGSITNNTSTTTDLTNDAAVGNNFTAFSESGGNNASYNTGNGNVTTGNANTNGTVLNGVNTNTFGTSAFTVANDHVGDIILTPSSFSYVTGCGNGCGNGSTSVTNIGNGAMSQNNGAVSKTTSADTTLANNANLENNVTLTAVSGQNSADYNNGTGNITTGDANVAANILNAVNANITHGGMFVVNVVGDLIGDIVLPFIAGTGTNGSSQATTVSNNGNGAGSQNNAAATNNTNANTTMANDATISNNLVLNGNTGGNSTNFNNSDNGIETGSVNLSANVVNVGNVNVADDNSGEPIWIVLVNNMGEWIGQIFDNPQGQTMAGSNGITFTPGSGGQTNASNTANGAYSQNDASVNNQNNSSTTLSNVAKINNNVTINADTGNNQANYNVGGASIKTGDVNAAVNILNFVNNNFSGRPVYIAVVNVFGKWVGDVVKTPKVKSISNRESFTPVSGSQVNNSGAKGSSEPTSQSSQAVGGTSSDTKIAHTPEQVSQQTPSLYGYPTNITGTGLVSGVSANNAMVSNGQNSHTAVTTAGVAQPPIQTVWGLMGGALTLLALSLIIRKKVLNRKM